MLRMFLAYCGATAMFAIFVYLGLNEYSLRAAESGERVIKITAHKFDYAPNEIRLKKDEPVILEFTSSDVDHGFNVPELGLRADVLPGKATRVRFTALKAGKFEVHCDNFCGLNHEEMGGMVVVE